MAINTDKLMNEILQEVHLQEVYISTEAKNLLRSALEGANNSTAKETYISTEEKKLLCSAVEKVRSKNESKEKILREFKEMQEQ